MLKIFISTLLVLFSVEMPVTAASESHLFWPGPRLRTLIERWQESELIVYVDVVETKRWDRGQLSKLKILKTIKGRVKDQNEIEVYVPLGSHWPYTFTETQPSIAFLKSDPKNDYFISFNGRDAGIDVDKETAAFYVSQYKKLPPILKIKDANEQLKKKVSWYVTCANQPLTRFEGVHGIHYLWNKSKKIKGLLTKNQMIRADHLLTSDEKRLLCDTLIEEDPPGYNARDLVRLLRRYSHPKLDQYLINFLKATKNNGWTALGHTAIDILPDRMNRQVAPEFKNRYDEFYDRYCDLYYLVDEVTQAEKHAAETVELEKQWKQLVDEFLGYFQGDSAD